MILQPLKAFPFFTTISLFDKCSVLLSQDERITVFKSYFLFAEKCCYFLWVPFPLLFSVMMKAFFKCQAILPCIFKKVKREKKLFGSSVVSQPINWQASQVADWHAHQGFLSVSLSRHSSGSVQLLQIPLIPAGNVGLRVRRSTCVPKQGGVGELTVQPHASPCTPLCSLCSRPVSDFSSPDCVHFPLPSSHSLPVSFLPLDGGKSNRLCTISAEGHLGVPSLSRLFKQSPIQYPAFPAFLGT